MSDQGQGRKRSSVLSAPKVGEGGWGDEGQKAWECSKLRIAPKNSTLERVLTGVDALASPGAPSFV
jgi:hypothetical protein